MLNHNGAEAQEHFYEGQLPDNTRNGDLPGAPDQFEDGYLGQKPQWYGLVKRKLNL